MPDYVASFLSMLSRNEFLLDRHPELEQWRIAALTGALSQDKTRLLIFEVQALLDEYKDFPSPLHRPPTEEQLHQAGLPDITVGRLVEDETVRVGLRLRGAVPHLLAAGTTGGGKTTLFRVIMDRVENLNAQNKAEEETD